MRGRTDDDGGGGATPDASCARGEKEAACGAAAPAAPAITTSSPTTTGALVWGAVVAVLVCYVVTLRLVRTATTTTTTAATLKKHPSSAERGSRTAGKGTPCQDSALSSRADRHGSDPNRTAARVLSYPVVDGGEDAAAAATSRGAAQNLANTMDVTLVGLETIDWSVLDRELDRFDRERHAALESLSFQLEVVQAEVEVAVSAKSDEALVLRLLADQITSKIQQLSGRYDLDAQVLRRIMRPFRYALALPPASTTTNGTTERRQYTEHIVSKVPCPFATPTTTSTSSGAEGASLERPMGVCRRHGWANPPADRSSSSSSTSSTSAIYGTVRQVVAHLVRDWSAEGAAIRRSLYDWCVERVRERAHEFLESSPRNNHHTSSRRPYLQDPTAQTTPADVSILVPGAGLGRLAYDLAASCVERPLHSSSSSASGAAEVYVHAIEPSLPMMAATAFLFDRQKQQPPHANAPDDDYHGLSSTSEVVLHPYASDPFTNEVDDTDDNGDVDDTAGFDLSFSSQRYRAVALERPLLLLLRRRRRGRDEDHHDRKNLPPPRAHLSFTVGDFASAVRAMHAPPRGQSDDPHQGLHHHQYGFVVTCFFLDTAANPIEYIRLVTESLMPGGYWINAGPLQWHAHAQLSLTSHELRFLLVGMGYDVVSWTVDADPLEYRSPSHRSRSSSRRPSEGESTTPTSTRVEAYHPLRFVARKRP